MQIIVSIFLNLKLVNVENTRFVVFMQGEITSKVYLGKKIFKRSFKLSKMIFFVIKKFKYDFLK